MSLRIKSRPRHKGQAKSTPQPMKASNFWAMRLLQPGQMVCPFSPLHTPQTSSCRCAMTSGTVTWSNTQCGKNVPRPTFSLSDTVTVKNFDVVGLRRRVYAGFPDDGSIMWLIRSRQIAFDRQHILLVIKMGERGRQRDQFHRTA